MRARIADLPDGSFEYETYAETGIATDDILIHSTITIDGDEILVDYAGSSPQTRESGVNCVLNCTRSLTLFPLHACAPPRDPLERGHDPAYPRHGAPGQRDERAAPRSGRRTRDDHAPPARSCDGFARPDHLATAITAASGIRWMLLADRVRADGSSRTISSFFQAGGMGASATTRRAERAGSSRSGPATQPVERFELDTGLTIERKALRQDSGGPGRYRGGCGQVIALANPGPDTVRFSFYRPQTRHGARGYFGGRDGKPGHITLNGPRTSTEGVLTLSPARLG